MSLGFAPGFAQGPSKLDTIPKTNVLKVGWAVFHPYIYRDPKTNQVTGFTIDLANEMAKGLGDKAIEARETNALKLAMGLRNE